MNFEAFYVPRSAAAMTAKNIISGYARVSARQIYLKSVIVATLFEDANESDLILEN